MDYHAVMGLGVKVLGFRGGETSYAVPCSDICDRHNIRILSIKQGCNIELRGSYLQRVAGGEAVHSTAEDLGCVLYRGNGCGGRTCTTWVVQPAREPM